jgi:parallel beta-helix repeat protein
MPHQTLTLTNNYAIDNSGKGIHVLVGPGQTKVIGNTAIGNATDLADDNPNCKGTTWKHNTVGTASQSCIE